MQRSRSRASDFGLLSSSHWTKPFPCFSFLSSTFDRPSVNFCRTALLRWWQTHVIWSSTTPKWNSWTRCLTALPCEGPTNQHQRSSSIHLITSSSLVRNSYVLFVCVCFCFICLRLGLYSICLISQLFLLFVNHFLLLFSTAFLSTVKHLHGVFNMEIRFCRWTCIEFFECRFRWTEVSDGLLCMSGTEAAVNRLIVSAMCCSCKGRRSDICVQRTIHWRGSSWHK